MRALYQRPYGASIRLAVRYHAAAPRRGAGGGPLRHERDVAVPMRDGTTLYADVYLPDGAGPCPALLERTPYNKESSSETSLDSPRVYTQNGYAVVIQDVRGRFKSEGDFYP